MPTPRELELLRKFAALPLAQQARIERLLDRLGRRTSVSVPQPVVPDAFALGADLFGVGAAAGEPTEPLKRAVWERLRAKHGLD